MSMTETPTLPHQLVLDERNRLTVSGITDVDSYDDSLITAQTALGELTIKGQAMQICRLNIESGDLVVDGRISTLEYNETQPAKGGFLKKIFK